MKGNIYILSCFISDSNNEWSYEEKMDIINKYHQALNWLKNQALRYNVTVNFEGGNFGLNTDIKLTNIEYGSGSGNEDVNMVSRVLKKIGYDNSLSFYNWVIGNTNCRNALVLIFVKGKGTGYAMAFETKDMNEEDYFVEGVMLYESYLNGYKLASSSIAHEILHLFGAWDFYKTFQQTQDREDKAKELFPNSIMLRTSFNINELYIDDVTAWLIGWKSNTETWYEWFNPYKK